MAMIGLACGLTIAFSSSAVRATELAGLISPRIVGGAGTAIDDFPFQVALYDPRAGSPSSGFFCGGVIIDATHVATAAHCVMNASSGQVSPPQDIEVLAGSTYLYPQDSGSVRAPVAATSFDPNYDSVAGDYDVGVLTLSRPLWSGAPPSPDGSRQIAPLVPDATRAARYANPAATPLTTLTVSGWGDINVEPGLGPDYPNRLQSVRLPLVADLGCQSDYTGIDVTITPRMICAGDGSRRADSCFGDSGGPLVVEAPGAAGRPADYVLAGLVDFGNGCAQRGYPGVYARIANPEIASFLTSNPPQAPLERPGSIPSLNGLARLGQQLSCAPGDWRGSPSFQYQFYVGNNASSVPDATVPDTPNPTSKSTYIVQPEDVGMHIFCMVVAKNRGGYSTDFSRQITVPGALGSASQTPANTIAPRLTVVAKSCARGRCIVNVVAAGQSGIAHVRTVRASLSFRKRVACRKHGKRTSCLRVVSHAAHVGTMPNGHFLIVVEHLAPGSYLLRLTAVNRAGVRQGKPTLVRLLVKAFG
jgi:secreted trypsin-like serine protease